MYLIPICAPHARLVPVSSITELHATNAFYLDRGTGDASMMDGTLEFTEEKNADPMRVT